MALENVKPGRTDAVASLLSYAEKNLWDPKDTSYALFLLYKNEPLSQILLDVHSAVLDRIDSQINKCRY